MFIIHRHSFYYFLSILNLIVIIPIHHLFMYHTVSIKMVEFLNFLNIPTTEIFFLGLTQVFYCIWIIIIIIINVFKLSYISRCVSIYRNHTWIIPSIYAVVMQWQSIQTGLSVIYNLKIFFQSIHHLMSLSTFNFS